MESMIASKKLLLSAFVVAVSSGPMARAGVIQLLSPADRSPNAKIDPFPFPEGTLLPSPFSFVTSDGILLTYRLTLGGQFLRGDLSGTTFLYNGAVITGVPSPVEIAFGVPMLEYSSQLLSNVAGDTTFDFTAFNGASALGTFSVGGPFGTPLFAGVRATGDDVITRLVISSPTNDFIFCNCGRVAVPEPATTGLLGLGVISGLIVHRVFSRN